MIYTEQTNKAMKIAYEAHKKQVDKSGVPYIFHPFHLAEQMETEEECIVALLHDTIEDTYITFEDLEKEFSPNIIEALRLLTHDKSVDYMEYIKKIKTNPLAKKVKYEDLKHNSDSSRLEKITPRYKKLLQKYKEAEKLLLENETNS